MAEIENILQQTLTSTRWIIQVPDAHRLSTLNLVCDNGSYRVFTEELIAVPELLHESSGTFRLMFHDDPIATLTVKHIRRGEALDEMELSLLADWCACLKTPRSHRLIRHLARMGRLRHLAALYLSYWDAKACIIWLKAPGKDHAFYSSTCAVGADYDLDVPIGAGIVGSIAPADYEKVVPFTEVAPFHRDAAVLEDWRSVVLTAVCLAGEVVAAISVYSTSDSPEPTSSDRHRANLLGWLTASIAQVRADSVIENDHSELAKRTQRLQVGLAVLGLAHDITSRSQRLADVARLLGSQLDATDRKVQHFLDELFRSKMTIEIDGVRIHRESIRQTLGAVSEHAEYLEDVISAVNDLSQTQRRIERVRLDEVVEKFVIILNGLRVDSRSQSIRLGPPCVNAVRVDATEIGRILVNSVNNSLQWGATNVYVSTKYFPPDTMAPRRRPDGASSKGRVVLTIRDDGVGMSREVLAHCQEPFYSQRASGSGLGMYVIAKIVDDLGGTLRIASHQSGDKHSGTTLSISIPEA